MPESKNQNVNPRITDVYVGIRDLRKIIIYPLSIGQQLRMRDTVSKLFEGMVSMKDDVNSATLAQYVLGFIEENIRPLLLFIISEKDLSIAGYENVDALLDDIDNVQLVEIVKVVYETNFKELAKNVKSLFEDKMDEVPNSPLMDQVNKEIAGLQSKRPQPQSVDTSQDTDSTISSIGDTEKEE